jgi:hypothetical protein
VAWHNLLIAADAGEYGCFTCMQNSGALNETYEDEDEEEEEEEDDEDDEDRLDEEDEEDPVSWSWPSLLACGAGIPRPHWCRHPPVTCGAGTPH